jgi:glycosyltransferase involved in cell wall biosynthesis
MAGLTAPKVRAAAHTSAAPPPEGATRPVSADVPDGGNERVRVLRIIGRLNVGGPAIHTTLLTDRLPARYASTLVAGSVEAHEGDFLALRGLGVSGLRLLPELGREIRGRQDVIALAKLVRLMRDLRPQVVHTHTAKAGTLGRVAAALCRVPVVLHTFHGHVLQGYFSPVRTRVFLGIERALARRTDCLVAVSPRVRTDLLSLGIGRPEAFDVVPLGLDLDRFTRADRHRGQLRSDLGLPPGVPLVGIVARLVAIKRHEVFLEAAARVAQGNQAHFVIVGDGERRAELERIAAEPRLESRVHFLGWRADLERLYADFDVVALTSQNEGSPVALIEAMAAARAVVSTSVGGVPDVVTDGVTGRLVPADDPATLGAAIDELLASPSLRDRLGHAARTHVLARYGADRLVADIDALYTRLLRAKGIG